MTDAPNMTTEPQPVTVTIDGYDRRLVAPMLRQLARDVDLTTVLNPEHPPTRRMLDARRARLTALADLVEPQA